MWLAVKLPPIQELLANINFSSMDDANIKLQQVQKELNHKPDPEMGNLTPDQVTRLIYRSWDDPINPLRLNKNLI